MYQRIRDLREDSDKTQYEIAKHLNLSQQAYSNYELGKRDVPTQVLLDLAMYHGTSTDYILRLTENPQPYRRTKNETSRD